MKTNPTNHSAQAFTLIELLTVIAIIGILAGIIIPVVAKVRRAARNATSISQMHQVAMTALVFANDNKDKLPSRPNTGSWHKSAFGKRCDSEHIISGVQIDPYLNWENLVWYDPLALEAAGISANEVPTLSSGAWKGRIRCNPAMLEGLGVPNHYYNKPRPIKVANVVRPSNALLFYSGDANSGVGTTANPAFKEDYSTCGFVDGSARRIKIPPGNKAYILNTYCTFFMSPDNLLPGFDK